MLINNLIEPNYTDRESKQRFVACKYEKILTGKVLDVGADEGYIKKYLSENVQYQGIGIGGNNKEIIEINLEIEKVPFSDRTFDVVMCLDVLEHLENIHDVFDELCRLSKKWIIISLPNPYNDIINYLRSGKYMGRAKNTKFYGIPKEREADRHKWFFSSAEAYEFVEYRAEKSGFEIYNYFAQIDDSVQAMFIKDRLHDKFDFNEISSGTMWWVLNRKAGD